MGSRETIPHNRWFLRPEYADAVLDVLGSRHVGQGREVALLEEELAARFRPGGECAVVSSGTAALYFATAGMQAVSIPAYACSSLYRAVRMHGIKPTIVDEGEFSTIGVHTFGAPSRAMMLIEDFTHAPGANVDGKPCGSHGMTFSVISFGATKPLGVGMGGAILGDAALIREIRAQRDYDTAESGFAFNFQLGDVYAAMVRSRLRRLDEENAWRRWAADLYLKARRPIERWVAEGSAWYRYVIAVDDWREAQEWFDARDIATINPLRPEELLSRRFGWAAMPVAEALSHRSLSVPIWPGMGDEQVERVAEALSEFSG